MMLFLATVKFVKETALADDDFQTLHVPWSAQHSRQFKEYEDPGLGASSVDLDDRKARISTYAKNRVLLQFVSLFMFSAIETKGFSWKGIRRQSEAAYKHSVFVVSPLRKIRVRIVRRILLVYLVSMYLSLQEDSSMHLFH